MSREDEFLPFILNKLEEAEKAVNKTKNPNESLYHSDDIDHKCAKVRLEILEELYEQFTGRKYKRGYV